MLTGTTHGTVTGNDGRYSIEVPPGSNSLTFAFLGMTPQEVSIGARNNIDITLSFETIGVEEVVVTALGIKREEKALGYSVQKVSGDELQKVGVVDVATSLSGKVAGLLVRNPSDFAAVPIVTIRGENPLIVIDGIAYANRTLGEYRTRRCGIGECIERGYSIRSLWFPWCQWRNIDHD